MVLTLAKHDRAKRWHGSANAQQFKYEFLAHLQGSWSILVTFSLKNLVLEACWSQEEALKRIKSLEDLLKHHFNLVFNLVSLLHYEQFVFIYA